MDPQSRNLRTMQEIYMAFGSGDIPAVLAKLSPDVDWEWGYPHNDDIPWLKHGRGVEHVGKFFQHASNFEIRDFSILTMMANEEWGIALISLEFLWKPTGKLLVEPCEPHIWRFGPDGKVISMRHGADTRQHLEVSKG
ncbi:MAG: hypothetical protein GMKNLPBB_00122 [Myxococcota bacterium]|nr:hypothetical protein [Myxococcota bacterium]